MTGNQANQINQAIGHNFDSQSNNVSCNGANTNNVDQTTTPPPIDDNTVITIKSGISPSNLSAAKSCPGILEFICKKNSLQSGNQVDVDSIPEDYNSRRYSDAERGRYLHALIVEKLHQNIYNKPENTRVPSLLDSYPQAKEIVDACVNYVQLHCKLINNPKVYIEHPLNCLTDYNIDGFWGRFDCAIVDSTQAEIIDFKTGYEPVESTAYLQLLSYAAGIRATHPDIDIFYLTIVQPKTRDGDNTSSVFFTAEELDEMVKREIIPSVLRFEAGELPFNAGDHCKKCPHLCECTAGLQHCLTPLADLIDLLKISAPKLDTYTLSKLIRLRDLQTICDNVRKRIIADINNGAYYPNIELQNFMTEVFDNEDVVAKKLQDFGIDPYKHTVKSPKEIKNLVDPKIYAEYIAPHVCQKLKSTSVNYCA